VKTHGLRLRSFEIRQFAKEIRQSEIWVALKNVWEPQRHKHLDERDANLQLKPFV